MFMFMFMYIYIYLMHGGEAALDMEPLIHSLLEVSLQRAVGVSATARIAHCAARVWVGAIEVRLPVVEAAVAQTSTTTVSGKEKNSIFALI